MSSESTASRLDRSARESRQRAPVAAGMLSLIVLFFVSFFLLNQKASKLILVVGMGDRYLSLSFSSLDLGFGILNDWQFRLEKKSKHDEHNMSIP